MNSEECNRKSPINESLEDTEDQGGLQEKFFDDSIACQLLPHSDRRSLFHVIASYAIEIVYLITFCAAWNHGEVCNNLWFNFDQFLTWSRAREERIGDCSWHDWKSFRIYTPERQSVKFEQDAKRFLDESRFDFQLFEMCGIGWFWLVLLGFISPLFDKHYTGGMNISLYILIIV